MNRAVPVVEQHTEAGDRLPQRAGSEANLREVFGGEGDGDQRIATFRYQLLHRASTLSWTHTCISAPFVKTRIDSLGADLSLSSSRNGKDYARRGREDAGEEPPRAFANGSNRRGNGGETRVSGRPEQENPGTRPGWADTERPDSFPRTPARAYASTPLASGRRCGS